MTAHPRRRRTLVVIGAVVAGLAPVAVEASPAGGGILSPG